MSQAETLAQPDDAAENASEPVASEPKSFAEEMDNSLLRALGIDQEQLDEDPAPADEGEEAPDTPTATAEQPEAEGEPDEAPPESRLNQWVADVASNPNTLDRIPPRHHKAVVEAIISQNNDVNRRAVELAIERGRQAGLQQAEQQRAIDTEVARLDTLADEEPEQFIRWQREYPDRAQAYFAIKGGQAAPKAAAPDPMVAAKPYLDQARALFERLKEFPAAHERVLAKAGDFQATAEGFAQFATLVADELAEAKAKKPDPAGQAIEKRKQAQAERKAVPRPETGTGRAAPTDELPEDPMTLIGMGFKKDYAKLSA